MKIEKDRKARRSYTAEEREDGRLCMAWTRCKRFFRSQDGTFWHTPRFVSTHFRNRQASHTSIVFVCGNIGSVSGPGDRSNRKRGGIFADEVPSGEQRCIRCAELDRKAAEKTAQWTPDI